MNIESSQPTWRYQFLYPVMVAALVGCCLVPIIRLCRAFGLDVGPYLMVVGIITTLQTFYARTILARDRVWGVRRYRIAFFQLSFLIVLTKAGELLYHLLRLQDQRFDLFAITPASLVVFTISILIWTSISSLASQFTRIQELAVLKYREIITQGYVSPYEAVMRSILAGGFLILLLAGFLQYAPINAPEGTGLSLYLPIYFLVALVLFSQVNYDHLRLQWNLQSTRIIGHTHSRWMKRSLALIGLATLIAFLMPTGYTLGLLDTLRRAFDVVDTILTGILYVINYLVVLLFSLIFSLLRGTEPDKPAVEPNVADFLPPEEAAKLPFYHAWNWPVIRTTASWIIAAVVLIIVVYSILKDNPEFLERARRTRLWQVIVRLWRDLIERLGRTASIVRQRLPKILPARLRDRRSTAGRAGWRIPRLNRMTPRERIRYYYLSILHRTSNVGLGRRPSQTPFEYQRSLSEKLTGNEGEIENLTGAFIEARYSPKPIDDEPPSAKEAWKRLREALQRLTHGKDDGHPEDTSRTEGP